MNAWRARREVPALGQSRRAARPGWLAWCAVLSLAWCAVLSLASACGSSTAPSAPEGQAGAGPGSSAGSSAGDSVGADPAPANEGEPTEPAEAGAGSGAAGSAGDADPPSPADTSGAAAEPGASLSETAAVEPSGAPLVDRAGANDFACTLARPDTALHDTPVALATDATLDGALHHVWAPAELATGSLTGPIATARVALDGGLESAQVVFMPDVEGVFASPRDLVAGHDRLTFVWDYSDPNEPTPAPVIGQVATATVDPTSGLIQLDADGQPLAPARPLDSAQFPFDARLIATRDGYLAIWSEAAASSCAIRIAHLDVDARLVGMHETLARVPVTLPAGGWGPGCSVIDAVETATGMAIVYARTDDTQERYAYQAFDADGRPLGPAQRLASDAAFTASARLIAHGDAVVAAWSVGVGESRAVGRFDSTLRVARFGSDGTLGGEVVTVASGREGQLDQYAAWLDLGDALGLAFSREQKQDPACTDGCTFTGVVEYVVIDPDELAPRGPMLEIAPAAAAPSGVSAVRLAGDAGDVLIRLDRWAYASASVDAGRTPAAPGTALIHCTR
jgi:hypothetical protein